MRDPEADEQNIDAGYSASDQQLRALVARFAAPHKRLLVVAVLMMPIVNGIQLLQPWLFKLAIDGPIAKQLEAGLPLVDEHTLELLYIIVAFFFTLLFAFGLKYILTWMMEAAAQRVVYDMRMAMFRHLQKQNLGFFEKNAVGRLMTRITNDLEGISEFFSAGLLSLVDDIFMLIGILIAMFLLSWKLTLLTFLVAPPLLLLGVYFRVRLRNVFLNIRRQTSRINAYLAESISGVQTIKLFTRAGRNDEEFERLNRGFMRYTLRSIWYDSNLYAVVELISTAATAVFIYFAATRVEAGAVTIGTVVAFIEYIKRFFVPIRDIGMKYSIIQSTYASANRVHQLLSTESILPAAPAPKAPERVEGRIEFKNVTFGYKPDEPILKNISFVVEPGTSLAVVGPTGAGKTTILKLINRFHDVWEGAVLLDGVDVRDYEERDLRRRIGQVLQDVVLFSGSVAQNIRLESDLTRERIVEVARQVQAHDFIERLPGGYDANLRERAGNISHGERQLLAFARVLAKDPQVFLFDEATSNIDSRTEDLIQRALDTVLEGRTSLIVAHRLSTITGADRILVMHRGEVVERGTHSELMAADGLYARLYRLQYKDAGRRLTA